MQLPNNTRAAGLHQAASPQARRSTMRQSGVNKPCVARGKALTTSHHAADLAPSGTPATTAAPKKPSTASTIPQARNNCVAATGDSRPHPASTVGGAGPRFFARKGDRGPVSSRRALHSVGLNPQHDKGAGSWVHACGSSISRYPVAARGTPHHTRTSRDDTVSASAQKHWT